MLLGTAVLAAVWDGVAVSRVGGGSRRHGLVTPFAETARLLRQRRRITVAADALLWRAGGAGLVIVPLMMIAVVPIGGVAAVDSGSGMVWFNAADVVVWALVWLLGWGANSIYALIGGYRFLAQALAYELPLMFALTTPAVAAHSLALSAVADAQQRVWFVVWMPAAFAVVCVGVLGFSVWGPLAPAAGTDLAGGVLAELSGPDRLLVLAGRYLLLAAGSAFAATAFLGGGHGPLLPGPVWLVIKTLALLAVLVVLRRRLSLLRPNRFLQVGWLVLLPVSLLQLLVVAIVVGSH
jgi:NADH-quinone oxidoreductase subunit H